MDELIGFPKDLTNFGLSELPPPPRKRIIDFLTRVKEFNDRAWVSKSDIQSNSGCSHQKTKDIIDSLLREGVIEYGQRGRSIYYKLTSS